MPATIQRLNPEGLQKSPAYSQAVAVFGAPTATIYVGGQNGIDASGKVVGDLAAQSAQAFANVVTALTAGGATVEHVVKWTVHLVVGQDVQQAFGAYAKAAGKSVGLATVSMVSVAALGRPEWLIEIDCIAVIP